MKKLTFLASFTLLLITSSVVSGVIPAAETLENANTISLKASEKQMPLQQAPVVMAKQPSAQLLASK